ncbi:MAG: SRPBCC family protein [Myxococcota bacterium]|nr:SRPBCC family protein [Myxococcota bacterium]
MFECNEFNLDYFKNAPVLLTYERELPVSPAVLFAIFEDEHSWPQWVPGIAKVDWTSPRPFGLNTTRTVTFTGGMEVYERFIGWEHGKHMAFCFTGTTQRVWASFGENYEVEDLGNNRCTLRWTVAYEPRFIFKALHPLLGPIMKKALGLILRGLKRYATEHQTRYIQDCS